MTVSRRALLGAAAAITAVRQVHAQPALSRIDVWHGVPPGGPGLTGQEHVTDTGAVTDVSRPRQLVYRPARPNGTAVIVYGLQVKLAYPNFVGRHVRVGTFVDAAVTFFVILYLTRRWGWTIALASGIIGTCAAPMLFEFPFDLIVMARTNPPIPDHPVLYRQLFLPPLFLTELSTVVLLTLLPSMRITAQACYALAGMFAVFAVWAWFGFAFPDRPLPLAMNVESKILCFVAAIMLFDWQGVPRSRSEAHA